MSSAEANLTPVSYVVLGLIDRDGPSTPYSLKAAASRGVAHFWPFPHSQLYDEPARLAAAGLLEEHREEGGRRRRTYEITKAGRRALQEWVRSPTEEAPQIRSLGLLKLFFSGGASDRDLLALARSQVDLHRSRLELLYPSVEQRLPPDREGQRRVLNIGRDMDRAMLEHWSALVAELQG